SKEIKMVLKYLIAVAVASLASAGTLPGPEERIAGGNIIFIEEAPYHVGVLLYDVQICGGAIYSERIVLTAAHCLTVDEVEHYSVRAGSSLPNSGGQVIAVQEKYPHEDYNRINITNDIAVLYLKDRLKLNTPRIRSIELTEKEPESGSECRVTGWGDTYSASNLGAPVLLFVNLTISNYNYCRQKYGTYGKITKGNICASAPGKDSCQRDSGGPLVSLPDLKLIGIVSWGQGCAQPDYPGVYTSVYRFRDWIANTTSKI
ncbi:hypothetical protein KR054_007733, partial [Drosophila jambulina]